MSNLSKETTNRIKADALKFGIENHGWDVESKDYLEGALHEAERAQDLHDTMEQIANAPSPSNEREMMAWIETARNLAVAAIAKYREVGNG